MKIKKLIISILIFIQMISISAICFAENTIQENNTTETTSKYSLKLHSDAAILMEYKSGKVLFEKKSEEKMYPASTTKILSAIIAIEKANLNDVTTVSKSAVAEMKSGYTTAYLQEGEKISVKNLLEVLLVHSANEASNVLAEHISGSIEKFVELMNIKAKEIGCTNTHFVTTNGLHDDNHYTTAKDLALIARYCMQNETFRKIASETKCTIPATNKSDERVYKNTNDMVIPTSKYYYPGCVGIKTGYTSQAKNCLVAAASKNGIQVISIVLGAGATEDHKSARYVDTKTLFDYAYNYYKMATIAKKSDVINTIEIKNGTKDTKSLDLILENDIKSIIKAEDEDKDFSPEIKLNSQDSAPISENEVMGTATYTVNGEKYTQNLLAAHTVVAQEDNTYIYLIIGLIVTLLTLISLILFMVLKKKKRYPKHF